MNKPLIIGYKGEIGSFVLSGLLRVMPKALDIWCVDINENEKEVIERIGASDVIFVCVPMQMTVNWILKYKDLLKDKIIIENCSLKEWIYNDKRMAIFDIRSMHILFRPSQTPNLEDRKIALFKGQFSKDMSKKLAAITQSKVVWYKNSEDHDREMAIQQALTHRVLLTLGDMLKACRGSTYVSKRVLELCERIKNGNRDLYRLIQENKYLPEKLEEARSGFKKFEIENYWD
jgi:prephenate dehydrogenase